MNMQIHSATAGNAFSAIRDEVDLTVQGSPANRQVAAAMSAGLSREEAVRSVAGLPVLPQPSVVADKAAVARIAESWMPSTMGQIFALITKVANEARQQSAQARYAVTESTIAKIQEQAGEIEKKAGKALMFAWINAGVALAQSGVTFGANIASLRKANAASSDRMFDFHMQQGRVYSEGSHAVLTSLRTVMDGFNQKNLGLCDAAIKEMDAQVERMRANTQVLQDSEESLKLLLQKALQTADAIQQSTLQARNKILG